MSITRTEPTTLGFREAAMSWSSARDECRSVDDAHDICAASEYCTFESRSDATAITPSADKGYHRLGALSWDGAKQEENCAGPAVASLKQKRNVRLLAHLTGSDAPDLERLTAAQADREWGALFSKWMAQQRSKAKAEL